MSTLARALVWLLAVWVVSSPAYANEGKPVRKKPLVAGASAEANGIPTVAIAHELLVFDFGPVLEGARPIVVATYELRNEAQTLRVPLVFASFDVADGAVRFDGEAVPSVRLDEDELPAEWETPDGKIASTTAGEPGASGLAFDLTIPPGEHTLSVRYEIDGAWEWSAGGSKVRYALRPATSWKAVEALDVQLRCPAPSSCSPFGDPDGKRPDPTATSLHWESTEDGHRGHASGLPDGEIAILVHMPQPLWVAWTPTASWIGGVVLALALTLAGVWLIARARNTNARVVTGIFVAVGVQFVACAYGKGVGELTDYVAPQTRGYGQLEKMVLAGIGGLIVGVVLIPIVSAAVVRARKQ